MTTTLLVLRDRLETSLGDSKLVFADKYTDALNDAIREVFPALHYAIDDRTLVTDNILPNGSMEWWTSATALKLWSATNATQAKTTTGGLYRHGKTSAQITASAADGYICMDSDNYPRLLDLMGKTIALKAWAYPQTANDAFLTIYTLQADGTAQTLNSTTACPAGQFTLLELEEQELNDDLVQIQLRLRVHTSGQYVYFDDARVSGHSIYEYMLPGDLQDGYVQQVWRQTTGFSDDACDELNPHYGEQLFNAETYDKEIAGTAYRFIHFPYLIVSPYRLRLVGFAPLSTLSADTDTIEIEGEKINLLVAYAKYKVYQMTENVPSSQDIRRYESASAKAYGEYRRLLPSLRMGRPSTTF